MAKETTYEEIARELKNRIYKPVYYLMGEESYYIAVSYTHLDAADEEDSVDYGGRRIIKNKKKKIKNR